MYFFTFLLSLQLVLFLLLKNPEVQTLASRLAAAFLSQKSGSDIHIGEIHISLTGKLRLKQLSVNDNHGQTMIAVNDLMVEPTGILHRQRMLVLDNLEMTGAEFALRKASHEELTNFAFFLQHFSEKDTTQKAETVTKTPWTLVCKNLSVRNGNFIYQNEDSITHQRAINFSDIHLTDFDLLAKNLTIEKDTISLRFQNLTLVEKSGFLLQEFSGHIKFSPAGLQARNMIITTNHSDLEFDLQFKYDDLEAYNDFVEKVNFELALRPSQLEMSDIGYFAETMFGMKNFLELKGHFSGTVSNIYGKDFEVSYGDATAFKGTVRMNGLPDFYTTFIYADIDELKTRATDVRSFALPGDLAQIPVPALLEKMETVNVKGNFTGFPNDFVARANVDSRLGSLKTDLVLKSLEPGGTPSYKGTLIASGLDAGVLFSARPALGRTSFYLDVNGSGLDPDSLNLKAKGVIHSLVLNGYNYKKIRLDGSLKNRVFEGHTKITDPNLGFVFDGLIDFKEEKPRFDFKAGIHNANLFALGLNPNDTLSNLSAKLDFDFYATGIDDIIGGVLFDSVKYSDSSGDYFMQYLELNSFGYETGARVLTLNSDFIDIDIEGSYTNSRLIPSIKHFIGNYSGVLASGLNVEENKSGREKIFLDIHLKNTDELTRFFLPDMRIAAGSKITGFLDLENNHVTINGHAERIDFGSLRFDDWYLTTRSDDEVFNLNTGFGKILLTGTRQESAHAMGADSLHIAANLQNDSTMMRITWNDLSNKNSNTGLLEGYVHMERLNRISAALSRVEISIDSVLWNVAENNKISAENDSFIFTGLDFYSDTSQVSISGGISKNPYDSLQLIFQKVNISELDHLLNTKKLDLDGILNGNLTLMNLYTNPNALADISINNLHFNKGNLGDMHLQTYWEDSLQQLKVDLSFLKSGNLGEREIIAVNGFYYPAGHEQNFDMNIRLSNLETYIFNPFLEGYATIDRSSLASGELHFTGSYAQPVANGQINLMRTQVLIDYLNTKYTATGSLDIVENAVNVNNLALYDIRQNSATCSGRIIHNYFRDFELDILITKNNFSALNTSSRDNELFYGNAVASGNVLITGPFDNVKMDINARTEEGTRVIIPISSALSVTENDFIIFLNDADTVTEEAKSYNLNVKGFTMNMDLSVTPQAEIEIYLPYNMGNIKGNGTGEIGLGINPRGDFSINGDYAISGGTFFFNFENLIGREFNIQEGSRISWSGDPYDAEVDIMATYKVKTTLAGLRLQTDSTAVRNTRVEVDCNINLKNELFNPDISFSIDFANVAEDTKQIIFASLDTTDQSAMSQQIISLLVIGNFSYTTGGPNIGTTGFKLLSNQLSDWLSRISKDLDIGINYQPGTELTEEELEVVLRTQLFNDRLSIDGNFGVRGNAREQNTSNVVGDIMVEYKITEDGRLRVKAFNRTNDISFLEDNAPYTQGVGVFFRKEFEKLRDLFRGDKDKRRDKERNPSTAVEQHAIKPEETEVRE